MATTPAAQFYDQIVATLLHVANASSPEGFPHLTKISKLLQRPDGSTYFEASAEDSDRQYPITLINGETINFHPPKDSKA